MTRVFLPADGTEFLKDKHFTVSEIEEGYLVVDEAQGRSMKLTLTRSKRKNFNATPVFQYVCKENESNPWLYRYDIKMYEAKELMLTCKYHLWHTQYSAYYSHAPEPNNRMEPKAFTTTVRAYDEDVVVIEVQWNGKEENFPELPEYCGKEVTGEKYYTNLEVLKRHKL